jgi:Iron-sulfur cluster assembly accessory protein
MTQTVSLYQSSRESAMFDLMLGEDDIRLTPIARCKIAELFADMDDEEVEAIRVFVSGGGCGGMTYGMTFTDTRNEYDYVLEGDGFKLYVDAIALNFLRGVEIDYAEGAQGASFIFHDVFSATGGTGTCSACGAARGGCA